MVRRGRFRVEPSVRLSNVTQSSMVLSDNSLEVADACLCPHSTQTLRTWEGGKQHPTLMRQWMSR